MPKPKYSMPAILLSGGKSSRMGADKNLLDYGKGAQWQVMHSRLSRQFGQVWISCRQDQTRIFEGIENLIIDPWDGIGPMAGIAGSMQRLRTASAFFVSCDLPFYDDALPEALITANDEQFIACCAKAPGAGHPEPLIAVWNENALPHLLSAIETKEYSLQKVLKANPHKTVEVAHRLIFNANTNEEYLKAKKM
ncbi:MAG: molybdenum cofactor guanylyltransferase [Bacteroidia bacterium]